MEIGQKQVNLQEYIRVLMKHRWTILTVFAVILVSVTIFSFTATPIYQGTTRIVIEKENPKVVSIQEVMSVDSSGLDYYQTQYKILESKSVANEVIKRLNLENNETFNPKPGVIAQVVEWILSPIAYVKSLMKTTDKDAALMGQPGIAEPTSPLVGKLLNAVKVTPIRNSRLVDVSFESPDPVLAARGANTLAKAYIDLNLQTKLKATQDAVNWLNQQIDQEKKKVDAADQALLRYKQEQGIVTDFSTNAETITAQKLAELNKQVVEATSRRVEAETRYRQAQSLAGRADSAASIPEVMSNPLIQEIKKQEVEISKRLSELSKRYGSNHPQIIALNNEMRTLNARKAAEIQRVVDSLHNQYRVALAGEQSLKGALGQQKGETLAMNQKAIDYTVLKREAETSREMFDLLVKRFKEASLTEDIRTGNIRVIDPAQIPKGPVKPKKLQNILLAIIVGLSLGVGLAFFLEYIDNTIKLPDEVTGILKIPYLGPVPAIAAVAAKEGGGNPGGGGDSGGGGDGSGGVAGAISGVLGNVLGGAISDVGKGARGAAGPDADPTQDIVVVHSPKSTASEAYRGIRTSLLFSSADVAPQIILVTSSGPREGKTTCSANIAAAMAQAGSRVIVVDCDLRRPRVHQLFGRDRSVGTSNILVANCTIDEAIQQTDIPNVDMIASGPVPPNPSELLGSKHMMEMLVELRGRYERIIIDSPPISAVTDAVILSKIVDGVVLVIRAHQTNREVIRYAITQLRNVSAHIFGAVLNGVDMGRDSYYYYQYYYYYYGQDGERKKKTRSRRSLRSRRYYGKDAEK